MKYRTKNETPFDEAMRLFDLHRDVIAYAALAHTSGKTAFRDWRYRLCREIYLLAKEMSFQVTRKKTRRLLKLLRRFDRMTHWPGPPTPEEQRALDAKIGRSIFQPPKVKPGPLTVEAIKNFRKALT